MVDLSIIIVSYNVKNLLRQCLASIPEAAGGLSVETIVVDNRSSDNTATMVRQEFPAVTCIESDRNGGYAYANNIGLNMLLARRETTGELSRYVLLLNPDTLLPPGTLSAMVAFLDDNPDAAVAGPRLIRPDGSLDLACRRSFPSPEVSLYRMVGLSRLFPRHRRFARYNLTYLDPNDIVEVDSVVGAFMLLRSNILDEVGLLDEDFFMYGEDLDWAYRIKQHGWKVLYNGTVQAIHYKGASSRQRSTQSTIEFYRAMLTFFRKHYSSTTPLPVGWLIVLAIYGKAALSLGMNTLTRWFSAGRRGAGDHAPRRAN